MSVTDEGGGSLVEAPDGFDEALDGFDEALDGFDEAPKQPKLRYTRDFLLSLSELEICKKLPDGFDRSLLSEFEEGAQDRPRSYGSLPSQGGLKYGSSPPTMGDSSNYSRGGYGRRESRSSGWSDKDSDSQSDMDSESGKRYGNQSRRSWQKTEHDGLLGSGSFPRPPGFASGPPAPKVAEDDHYRLKRSSEPYHPPRPFKALPQHRSNANDSCNDETFGSSEYTSEDRADEERKRRASFELLRKEQHKVHQENQKLNANKQKSDHLSDLDVVLDEPKDETRLPKNNDEFGSVTGSVSIDDPGKPPFLGQPSGPRPLVPPGFTSSVLEKNSGPKPLISLHEKEVLTPEVEEIRFRGKANSLKNEILDARNDLQSLQEMDLNQKHPEDKTIPIPFLKKGEDILSSSLGLGVSTEKVRSADHLDMLSGLSEFNKASDDSKVIDTMTKKKPVDKIANFSNQEMPTSILDKLFGGVPTVNIGGSQGFIEHQDSKPDSIRSPSNVRSSKFAQWFHEDDNKSTEDLSTGKYSDLLSLIVGSDKAGTRVSDTQLFQPPYMSSELSNITTSTMPSAIKQADPSIPVVLTCEDLEQKILSEYSEGSSEVPEPVQDWNESGLESEHSKRVDNNASHHLLSLLQKGASFEDTEVPSKTDSVSGVGGGGGEFDQPRANSETIHNPGQSLTLETLFGTAFMKELQSAEAPVSVQRGSVEVAKADVFEPTGLSLPMRESFFSSSIDNIAANRKTHESNILAPTQNHPPELDKLGNWLRLDDKRRDVGPLPFQTELVPNQGIFDGANEIQLPEEESLITVSDSMTHHNPLFIQSGNTSNGKFLSSDRPIDITEKFAALNSGYRGERTMTGQEGGRFVRGPFDFLDPKGKFDNIYAQASPPQIHLSQVNNHGRTSIHSLDPHPAHFGSPMRFPEHIRQHDILPNRQFPEDMLRLPLRHPETRVTGFDIPAHHQVLPQMQMPGNFSHLLRDFPRGSAVPPHPSIQATNFSFEPETAQGFPFGHRQPNMGGLGMLVPGPNASTGSNNPDAFQRLRESELRANPRHNHPSFGVGGDHTNELDMGFRYR